MKIIEAINNFRFKLAIAIMPDQCRARIGFAGKILERMAEQCDMHTLAHAILFDKAITVFVDVSRDKKNSLQAH